MIASIYGITAAVVLIVHLQPLCCITIYMARYTDVLTLYRLNDLRLKEEAEEAAGLDELKIWVHIEARFSHHSSPGSIAMIDTRLPQFSRRLKKTFHDTERSLD